MKTSSERILTTHVGSLPRSEAVTEVLFARENGELENREAAQRTISEAVREVVRRQVATGIDIVNDGEMNKISYATYIKDRLAGFGGDTPREPGQDLVDFPGLMEKLAKTGATATYKRPRCIDEIRVKDLAPLHFDIENLKAAAAEAKPTEIFMNAASPGVIGLFQPNDYYASHEAYLQALADAMRAEYETIAEAGLVLQLDAPDFGMGRHTTYRDESQKDYLKMAEAHVEVVNHALANIPADQTRLHMCWGNYEGPHHHDVPMEALLPVVAKVKVQAILFEASNPRHAHEWTVFRELDLPEDKIFIPGVLDTTTNYIEHPLLVAERLERFANMLGKERVIAGTDCGFGTFAGFGPVDPDIVYRKLGAMVEGAEIASERV